MRERCVVIAADVIITHCRMLSVLLGKPTFQEEALADNTYESSVCVPMIICELPFGIFAHGR
jgi:hypothetical protein